MSQSRIIVGGSDAYPNNQQIEHMLGYYFEMMSGPVFVTESSSHRVSTTVQDWCHRMNTGGAGEVASHVHYDRGDPKIPVAWRREQMIHDGAERVVIFLTPPDPPTEHLAHLAIIAGLELHVYTLKEDA